MLLACQNISKAFGTKEVLKDINFHVNEKEKIAIVGINGSGKTTLLKIIMGERTGRDCQGYHDWVSVPASGYLL